MTKIHSPQDGVTLVELMVMSVIASLVALTVIQGFSGISRGIIASRFKSVATQLANERMQSLKGTSYYRLRVSSTTITPTGMGSGVFSPYVYSDATNYPPVVSTINGVPFTVYTMVERVMKNGTNEALTTQPWNAADTGLKRITLSTVWREKGTIRRVHLINLLENPDRMAPMGDFIGTVRDLSTTAALSNVTVSIAEVPSLYYFGTGGGYRLGAPAGTYTLTASRQGYFPQTVSNQVISSTTPQVTVNFLLPAKASGTITGTVWHNDHLVISRVCAEKVDPITIATQEYVEIFNPTTWTWTVDGQYGLYFQGNLAQASVSINYAPGGNNIAPGGFYLFASQSPVNIDGTLVTPDAIWENAIGGPNDTNANFPYFNPATSVLNILPKNSDGAGEGVGTLTLYRIAGGATIDQVGWQGGGSLNPTAFETAPVPDVNGMETNEIYYRKTAPAGGFSSTVGPAYDSGNNSLDWGVDPGAPHALPRNTATAAPFPIVSGVPSTGARVFANDGMSAMVTASTGAWSPPEARFTLPAIATGTWTVRAALGNYLLSFSTMVTAGVTTSTSIVMNTSNTFGFMNGQVVNAATLQGIAGITVTPGPVVTNAQGFFDLAQTAGTRLVYANQGPLNPGYTETSKSVTFTAGQMTSNHVLSLSAGATITGTITVDGVTPLPNVPVQIINNQTSYLTDNPVSNSIGGFSATVPLGTYTVLPAVDVGETVTPITNAVSLVTGGSTVFSATYTVTSAYGTLAGTVSTGGKGINTGVLIMVSTSAVPATPLDINDTFRKATVYFSSPSRSDGTYSFNVKNGTYTVSGFYTTFNGNTPVVVKKEQTGVVVNPRQTTTVHFTW